MERFQREWPLMPRRQPNSTEWGASSLLLTVVGLLLAVSLCASPVALHAQPVSGDASTGPTPGPLDDPKAYSGFSLFVEQDKLYPPANQDRNYTMGVGIGFGGELGYTDPRYFHPWRLAGVVPAARNLLDRFVLDRWVDGRIGIREYSWMFGVTAFTPDDLQDPNPIPDDRPYASLAFLSSRQIRVDAANEQWAVTTDFALGLLGTNIADNVQSWLHENIIDGEAPLGWDNQISDGGELTALYGVKIEVLPRRLNSWFDKKGVPLLYTIHAGAQVGYYQALYGGLSLRLGRVRSPFWQWSSNPLNIGNEALDSDEDEYELFVFGALRGRGIRHNSLLEGQFGNDDPVTVEAAPFLIEGEAGVSWAFNGLGRRLGLTYVTVAGRTREFEGGAEARSHLWGSLFITVSGR